ncbi:MAG: hypothetical protein IPO66_12165 [Rhodanobacteraceae bacterium]|nr:hypothetical protein [Rhodanobacteraceae bacterium]
MRTVKAWMRGLLALASLCGGLAVAQPAPQFERLRAEPTVTQTSARIVQPRAVRAGAVRLDASRMRQLSPRASRNLAQLLAQLPPAAKLEIWDGLDAPPSDFFRVFAGPVTADRGRNSLKWFFRFSTEQKPVAAVYQVSLFPFTTQGGDPLKPPGLLAQGAVANVPSNGGMALFTIDFGPIVRGRPWAKLQPPRALTTAIAGDKPASASLRPDAVRANALRPELRKSPEIKVQPPVDAGLAQLQVRPPTLHSGYWVRVVLRKAGGGVIGAPSNAVYLAFEQLPPQQDIELVMGSHPQVRFDSYRPVQADDWAQVCIREYVGPPVQGMFGMPGLLTPGMLVDACAPDDDGFLDDLGDAISGFFGALGDLVDAVGAAYEWAKSQAVALAAAAIDQLGLPCPCPIGSCEVCLTAALDYGLASLGIPPTLPSFDELVDEGVDYIAATVAAETGLPAAEAMEVARELAKASDSGSAPGAGAALWRPLPQHLYAPLLVKLRVNSSRWPVNLVIEDSSGRYQRALVPVPALAQTIVVPVALQPVDAPDAWRQSLPTLDSLPQAGFAGLGTWFEAWLAQRNTASAQLELWRQRYRSGEVRLQIRTLSAIGSGWSEQQQMVLDCSASAGSCDVSYP